MKSALFLDRDGVINKEKNYLYKKDDFEFIDGIFDLCHYYQKRGYLIFVVTNQSGIARNYYSENDFLTLTEWMVQEFKKNNVDIAKVYYCPHHPEISGSCSCRKPNPGMIFDAARVFNIDLNSSVLVGDKECDIEAGLNAGIGQTYLFSPDFSVKKSQATKIIKSFDEIWRDNANIK